MAAADATTGSDKTGSIGNSDGNGERRPRCRANASIPATMPAAATSQAGRDVASHVPTRRANCCTDNLELKVGIALIVAG